MEFTVVKFFTYDIRSTVIDSTRMFLVSDLLNQYNEKHGTNKKFKDYLRIEQTKELLENWPKYTRGEDLHLVCQPCTNDSKWNIDEVIKYVSFSKVFGTASQGYVARQSEKRTKTLLLCHHQSRCQYCLSHLISHHMLSQETVYHDNNMYRHMWLSVLPCVWC